jgi:hypothetical protein
VTSIDRDSFSRTLSQTYTRFDLSTPTPQLKAALDAAGIDADQIRSAAGSDQVIEGNEEFKRLYDRLQELDRESGAAGKKTLDRATTFFNALRTPDPSRVAQVVDDGASASNRRGVGIGRTERRDAAIGPAVPAQNAAPIGSAPTSNIEAEVDRLRELPAPIAKRGEEPMPTVQSYLDAIDAFQSGSRARPRSVNGDQWALARALQMQGVQSEDVRTFLATGTLADVRDADGKVIKSGDERMAELERAATEEGSWPAVNSLTFLVSMRRSAMLAERSALESSLGAATADSRTAIEQAIEENKQADKQLRNNLQSVYTAATYARERSSRNLIGQADKIDRQAAALIAKGGAADKADQLKKRAQELRDQSARIAFDEAKYRASMKHTGWNAGTTYRVAAEAQIKRGEAEIAAMRADQPLPENAPAVLGKADETATPNHVPGAASLLESARATDPNASRDHAQLALEGERNGALAAFHGLHLDRAGYFARVEPNKQPPARTQEMLSHRSAYLDARMGQLKAADARLDLYGPASKLNAQDALDAERVAGQRMEVASELNSAVGSSLSSDRQVTDQRARLDAAKNEAASASQALVNANRTFNEAAERERDARGSVGWTDALKTGGEASRDSQSVKDARTITEQSRVQVEVAKGRDRRAQEGVDKASADLKLAEAQQRRDGQDAELVRRSLGSMSVLSAYSGTRDAADKGATQRMEYVRRAEQQLGAKKLDDVTRAELASARLDVSRWYRGSVEIDLRARDNGRAGAEDRLSKASSLVDEADALSQEMARGEVRANLASASIDQRAGLAESWADYRPQESLDQLRRAEATSIDELTFGKDDEKSRIAAYEAAGDRIGSAAVVSLVRRDARFSDIVGKGRHVPGVADDLYKTAHRLLDDRRSADTADARKLLRKIDDNKAAFGALIDAAGAQVQNGQDFAAAQTRTIGRADIALAQAQVSSIISGPVWLFTLGHVDMKEEMADHGTENTNRLVASGKSFSDRVTAGAQDLSNAWRRASAEGRAFDFMDSVRIFADPDLRMAALKDPQSDLAKARAQSLGIINGFMPADRASRADHQDFFLKAVRGETTNGPDGRLMYVSSARSLVGPMMALSDANAALGDRRLAAMIADHVDAEIQPQIDQLNDTKKGQWRAYVNLVGEVAIGAILTGGAGSVKAVATVAEGAELASAAAEAANAARLTMVLANAAKTAGHALVVGGVLMGANWGMARVFGANSTGARTFQVATNFIPFAAMQRASGMARLLPAAENAGRLAQATRALTSAGLAGGQAFVSAYAVNKAVEHGLVRSELGQMALGLGINTLMAGGMGAYVGNAQAKASRAQSAQAIARGLVENISGRENTPQSLRVVAGDVERFLGKVGSDVPSEAALGELRGNLYERFGAGKAVAESPDRAARREAIDNFVEAIRVQRAIGLGWAEAARGGKDAPSKANVQRAVELAGERLFAARGGEGRANRLQAFRDAASAITAGFGVDAAAAGRRSGGSADAARMVRAETWAADRVRAAELAHQLEQETITALERPRVESILAGELSRSDRGPTLGERAADPQFWTAMRSRLVNEAKLSPSKADAVVAAAHRDFVTRFEGPNPQREAPDPAAIVRARQELARLAPGQKLSAESARVLLDETVYAARQAIARELPGEDAFSARRMCGACGFGQAATAYRLMELGVRPEDIRAIQAADVFGNDGQRHAFLVAKLKDGKTYLIDTTFRQFFDSSSVGERRVGMSGALMRESEGGSRIADQILARGYVELTPEVAKAYGEALGLGTKGKPITLEDYTRGPTMKLDLTKMEVDLHVLPATIEELNKAGVSKTAAKWMLRMAQDENQRLLSREERAVLGGVMQDARDGKPIDKADVARLKTSNDHLRLEAPEGSPARSDKLKKSKLGKDAVIVDSNLLIALDKQGKGGSPADERTAAFFHEHLASKDVRVTDVVAAEIESGHNPERLERMRGVPLVTSPDSPEYKGVLSVLRRYRVGTMDGVRDRAIVADALFASTERGVKPTLYTGDNNVLNPLARIAGIDVADAHIDLRKNYAQGFDVTINGRTLHVVPVPN